MVEAFGASKMSIDKYFQRQFPYFGTYSGRLTDIDFNHADLFIDTFINSYQIMNYLLLFEFLLISFMVNFQLYSIYCKCYFVQYF